MNQDLFRRRNRINGLIRRKNSEFWNYTVIGYHQSGTNHWAVLGALFPNDDSKTEICTDLRLTEVRSSKPTVLF